MTMVVTGATGSIGLATAERLAHEGSDVVLLGRSRESARRAARLVEDRAAPESRVTSHAADLARPHDVHRVAEQVATTPTEVADVMQGVRIAHVFIGPGLAVATRLDIVREVLLTSDTACIHLKDTSRGPEGALDFVRAILTGVRSQYHRTGP